MSSRIVERLAAVGADAGAAGRGERRPRGPGPRRSWSVVARLAALYCLSSCLLFGGIGALLQLGLREMLQAEARRLLVDKVAVLREILRERPQNDASLQEEVEWESSARRNSSYYARLRAPDGTVKLASDDAGAYLPGPVDFPAPASAEASIGATRLMRRGGRPLLLTAARALAADGEDYTYELGLDVTGQDRILVGFRAELMAALAVLAALSAVTGTWVARRGMRPVAEITRAAQRITASALDERISAEAWPRELAALAREFDRMLERLGEAFERLTRFSADLAHELRTPLHNLLGEAQVALAKPRAPAEYQRVLQSGVEECERLAQTVDGMLFLARADGARVPLRREPFSGREAAERLAEIFEVLASEGGVGLRVTGEATVEADPELFRRLLSNLVANALQHTPAGGRVEVTLHPLPIEGVELTVADTGAGIAPEHLPRLFDRFYRAQAARGLPGGSGLGLSICKGIVDLHGGTIGVNSKLGGGTTVTVTLPAGRHQGAPSG